MRRFLVLYGTTNGQAGKVARFIRDELRTRGHEAEAIDASTAGPDPARYEAIVVVASVHAGGYQRPVERWVRQWAAVLDKVPTAFVSVCLGVLQHDPAVDREIASIAKRFVMATGWTPGTIKVVAGALSYTQYNLLTRWLMRRIARKAGGATDTSRDYEYTDWEDVRAFTDGFARRVVSARADPARVAPFATRARATRDEHQVPESS